MTNSSNINFWHMQLHPNQAESGEWDRNKIAQILYEENVIGLGQWPEGEHQIRQFRDDMNIGDVILIRGDGPIALVQVTGDAEFLEKEFTDDNFDWFENRRTIKVLGFYQDYKEKLPSKLGKGYWGMTLQKCKEITGSTNDINFTIGDYIRKWFELTRTEEKKSQ